MAQTLNDLRKEAEEMTDTSSRKDESYERLKSFRAVGCGNWYSVTKSTRLLMKDGIPISSEEAAQICSSWCARRLVDPDNFKMSLNENIRKLQNDLSRHPTELRFKPEIREAEIKAEANYICSRIQAVMLPLIPGQFKMDGHTYTWDTSKETKTHFNWITPDEADTATCMWSNVPPATNSLTTYWPDKTINVVKQLFTETFKPELKATDEASTGFALYLMGKMYVRWEKALIIEGHETKIPDIF